jgi:hypothetical protein
MLSNDNVEFSEVMDVAQMIKVSYSIGKSMG